MISSTHSQGCNAVESIIQVNVFNGLMQLNLSQ